MLKPVLAALLLLVGVTAVCAITVAPPPNRADLCRAWVAFSTDDLYSMRLELKSDGTGNGVLLLNDEAPEAFKITSWQLDDYSLALTVRFRNAQVAISSIKGSFKERLTSYIVGTLKHPDRISEGWLPGPLELSFDRDGRIVRFGAWPEHDLQHSLDALKKAARR